jgi:hypothetical protein
MRGWTASLPAFVAATIVSLTAPAASLATSLTVAGTIAGSALSVSSSAAPSFTANLDAGDATPSYSIALATQDTAGTGAGWNETITSTQFATDPPNSHVLAPTASTVTGVVATDGVGTDTPPANVITYPLTVPAGPVAPPPVKIFDATPSTGMGQFTVSPTISVFVPQDSYAGTYTTTLTLGIVSGP